MPIGWRLEMKDGVSELTAGLAEAVGLNLPEDRLEVVSESLGALLALAVTLRELPLAEVEPAPPIPDWQ
jgi:hypothetical protein